MSETKYPFHNSKTEAMGLYIICLVVVSGLASQGMKFIPDVPVWVNGISGMLSTIPLAMWFTKRMKNIEGND